MRSRLLTAGTALGAFSPGADTPQVHPRFRSSLNPSRQFRLRHQHGTRLRLPTRASGLRPADKFTGGNSLLEHHVSHSVQLVMGWATRPGSGDVAHTQRMECGTSGICTRAAKARGPIMATNVAVGKAGIIRDLWNQTLGVFTDPE